MIMRARDHKSTCSSNQAYAIANAALLDSGLKRNIITSCSAVPRKGLPGRCKVVQLQKMSDSEDDKPLAARNIPVKQPAAASKTSNAAASSKPSVVIASNPQDVIKRKAAQKAPVIDTSDSEDDNVLVTRAKPAARPGDDNSKVTVRTCKEDSVCCSIRPE